jgi:chromate reductase
MTTGYIVGSISSAAINRRLADALVRRAGEGSMAEIRIADLPLYNYDLDRNPPAAALAFKAAIEACDTIVFLTPEYNRSIPGALKNALDWGSRPWGDNSFAGRRAAILGTGLNSAGSAVAQSHLRSILGYLQMTVVGAPETCIPWSEGVLDEPQTHSYLDAFWESVVQDRAAPAVR